MDLQARISEPAVYLAQLDRLDLKSRTLHRKLDVGVDHLSLQAVLRNRKAFAKILCAEVAEGTHRFTPAQIRTILLDKEREIITLKVPDLVIHGVLAEILREKVAKILSPGVYSYQIGRSSHEALLAFGAFVREHRRARPEPKTRGLYILRCDVRKYTETIPVTPGAPLWAMLQSLLGTGPLPSAQEGSLDWLVSQVIRPQIQDPGSKITPHYLDRGIPTGSPISPQVANLYLHRIDQELEGIEGGFYARFGDDIVFAHPDLAAHRGGWSALQAGVKDLGLDLNPKKLKHLYFNGAGRPSDVPSADYRPASRIEFLGYEVDFQSAIRLSPKKLRLVLLDLQRRMQNVLRLLPEMKQEELGHLLCETLNRALDPTAPGATLHARTLLQTVSDRKQLQWLDHWIASRVSSSLTGISTAQTFRRVSWGRLRTEMGLRSLVRERNGRD